MNLVRFQNPHYRVNRSLVDELYNSLLKNDSHENYVQNCSKNPATNVFETEKDFRIEVLLPGFSKEDLNMNNHKNVLTVKVEKEEKEERAAQTLVRQLIPRPRNKVGSATRPQGGSRR